MYGMRWAEGFDTKPSSYIHSTLVRDQNWLVQDNCMPWFNALWASIGYYLSNLYFYSYIYRYVVYLALCTFQPKPLMYKSMAALIIHSVLPVFYPFPFSFTNKLLQYIDMRIIGIVYYYYNIMGYPTLWLLELCCETFLLLSTFYGAFCRSFLWTPLNLWTSTIFIPLLFILKGEPGIMPLVIRNFHTQTGWCVQLPIWWILIYYRGWDVRITPCPWRLLPIELTWPGGGGKYPKYPLVKPWMTYTGGECGMLSFLIFFPN